MPYCIMLSKYMLHSKLYITDNIFTIYGGDGNCDLTLFAVSCSANRLSKYTVQSMEKSAALDK